jgi:hypothetical protein
MIKVAAIFLFGVAFGGAVVWWARPQNFGQTALSSDRVEHVESGCAGELEAARAEVAELSERLSKVHSAPHHLESSPVDKVAIGKASEAGEPSAPSDALRWKVSAIEKFVPLNDEQRQRLREKFDRESSAPPGEESGAESLEDIVGAENARFYREQVKAAFKRVQDEEIDREVVWLSRQLALSPDQERSMRSVFEVIERRLNDEGTEGGEHGGSPQERVKTMVSENRRRNELRNEELKSVLSPEQYEAYLRTNAESSAADVEIFHE